MTPENNCRGFKAAAGEYFSHNPLYKFTKMHGTTDAHGALTKQTVSALLPGQKLWSKTGKAFLRISRTVRYVGPFLFSKMGSCEAT